MKYINASGGGGGGTSSDELTAVKAYVLEAYTAVTKDSDDEPAAGTMKNLTNRASIKHTSSNATKVILADDAFRTQNSDGVTRVQLRYNAGEGYIANNTLIGFPESQAGAKFGITADKIANGQVVLGMTGTYKGLGNATAAQVLTGYSFSTASLSNAGGSMPNHGAWGTTLAINGSVTIPAGYHNGSGKISQSIATKGATTITPKAAQQTAVGAGTYCSGNIIVAGNGNFVAGNIKKGVNIWGVVGTFEGYVPTATDLYNRGANPANFYGSSNVYFDSNQIRMSVGERKTEYLYGRTVYNFTPYSGVSISANKSSAAFTGEIFGIRTDGGIVGGTVTTPETGSFTVRIPFSNFAVTGAPQIYYSRRNAGGVNIVITRIWFS